MTMQAVFLVTKKSQSGSPDPELALHEIELSASHQDYTETNKRFFGNDSPIGTITFATRNKGMADFFQIGRIMTVDFEEQR